MNKRFSFLSGLPRTGSTLLSSILSQNPQIHSEGHSLVCHLIWNMHCSSGNTQGTDWNPDILVSGKQKIVSDIIASIPNLYYANVEKPFILDKGRTWTLPDNIKMIKQYITEDPKIVVLIRPVEEIVSSFVRLRLKNNFDENHLYTGLIDNGIPIMAELDGVVSARENNTGEFLFIEYDEIIFDTEKTLDRIYDFCGWPKYKHDLQNITRNFIQNDEVYFLDGLHEVRKTIEKQKYHIDLPKNILKKCQYYNSLIFED
jgi:sulfotransferase